MRRISKNCQNSQSLIFYKEKIGFSEKKPDSFKHDKCTI